MKTRYTHPELSFILLDSRDVILASGTPDETEKAKGIGINSKDIGTLPEIPFESPEK